MLIGGGILEVVGIKSMDFVGETGQRIVGFKLYCISDDIAPNKGSGREVFSFFTDKERCPELPAVGSQIEVSYNRFGRVNKVVVC